VKKSPAKKAPAKKGKKAKADGDEGRETGKDWSKLELTRLL
jgi:hypothetical protein